MRQAVVLAGGFGRRLHPLTQDRPKAMVDVCGTPILRHQIDWFAECGVEHVVISAGHLAAVIIDYLRLRKLPLRVRVVVEEKVLGRGGGLKRAAGELPRPDEPWLAAYGDIWTHFSIPDMYAHHRRHGLMATVALTRPPGPRAGVACNEQGRVTALRAAQPPHPRVNAGIYVFTPDVVGLLPDQGDHAPTALAHLIRTEQLMGYPVDVPWWAINTVQDLNDLERALTGLPSDRPARGAPSV
ncbi:nucleotidyltransferase family protein [Actinomadura algeriensis]|uniref:NDP-sugar pyrophosphorylase family protein n=1 Tax=Actinomadura algeriensis TaxID=1679523 RepID=A0ABR9JP42_9ACTN|nr:nucleotidyltransferase family protein [Actinomadura algeriensis]MBE1532126.1 NDP-sugar pyrophosphorylase family protein [Actinomadura algeriensis]